MAISAIYFNDNIIKIYNIFEYIYLNDVTKQDRKSEKFHWGMWENNGRRKKDTLLLKVAQKP